MRKIFVSFYHLFIVPFKTITKLLGLVSASVFVLCVLFYGMTIEFILNQDILQADINDVLTIQNWKPRDNTVIYDKDGKIISEQFNEYHIFTPYEKIPKKMINAILAIEDRKFFQHQGIDVFSIVRAIKSHVAPNSKSVKQGASTITQQVVKNLILTNEKTVTRKLREIVLSLYIEKIISKEKIIEIYCNTMFLGQGSYGVAAAAKRFFNKELSELDYHETALIAGLFQSPGRYNPNRYPEKAKKRQQKVLRSIFDSGYISKVELDDYKTKKLEYQKYKSIYGQTAPYFVDYVLEESHKILKELNYNVKDSGLKIYTTLDSKLDKIGQDAFANSSNIFRNMEKSIIWDNLKENTEANDVEAAALILDRRTGKILTMIGGRNYQASQFNRAANGLRAPGSVFKTFTYALGLKKGIPWNKQYYVSPITIGNYRPKTQYSKLFTETTLLKAFYQSINSPAVLLGDEVGMIKVFEFAKKLGVETPLKEEAATLLGGSEVSMLDMARAYQVIANNGNAVAPMAIEKIVNRDGEILFQAETIEKRSKKILDRRTNELITEGLKSVVRYGTAYKARHLSGRAAGKTGTSNKSKDNWFCGFTDDLVAIVWLGNDDQNSFRSNISAANTAVPLWANIIGKANRHLNTGYIKRSRSLEMAKIHPHYGHRDRSGVRAFFLPGKAPKETKSDLMVLESGQKLRVGMNDF